MNLSTIVNAAIWLKGSLRNYKAATRFLLE